MKKKTLLFAMCLGLHFMGEAQQREAALFNTIGKTQTKEIVSEPTTEEISGSVDADSLNKQESMEFDTTTYNAPLMVSLPLKEIKVNSPFGMRRDPMNRKKNRMHNGLDLKARFENVYSMFPGTVIAASYSSSGGYYVTVDYGVCTCSFLHLSKIEVSKGQRVSAGQKIGVSGNTGKRTTGPHLHLSCKWSDTGKYFDPKVLLRFITNELLKYSKTCL